MNHSGIGNGCFIGTMADRRSPRFHRPYCRWVPDNLGYLLAWGKWTEFTSHEEAITSGYKACSTCSP